MESPTYITTRRRDHFPRRPPFSPLTMPPPIPPPIQPPIQPPIPPTTNLSTNEISRSLVYLRRTRQRLLVGPHAVLHLPHSTHISGGAKNIQYFALSLWDHTFGQTWEMGLVSHRKKINLFNCDLTSTVIRRVALCPAAPPPLSNQHPAPWSSATCGTPGCRRPVAIPRLLARLENRRTAPRELLPLPCHETGTA